MTKSTQMAGLIGPTMIALAITEWINLDMMLVAAGPGLGNLVYLNGTLLFVAGLSIVRAHNRWSGGWPIAVTLTGWLVMFFGLARMIAPVAAQRPAQDTAAVHALLAFILIVGAFLTYKSFRPGEERTQPVV